MQKVHVVLFSFSSAPKLLDNPFVYQNCVYCGIDVDVHMFKPLFFN